MLESVIKAELSLLIITYSISWIWFTNTPYHRADSTIFTTMNQSIAPISSRSVVRQESVLGLMFFIGLKLKCFRNSNVLTWYKANHSVRFEFIKYFERLFLEATSSLYIAYYCIV